MTDDHVAALQAIRQRAEAVKAARDLSVLNPAHLARWVDVELLLDLVAEQAEVIAQLRAEAAAILEGFKDESRNGVVCSIPDAGIGVLTHRTWCARCKKRYQRLEALAAAQKGAPQG